MLNNEYMLRAGVYVSGLDLIVFGKRSFNELDLSHVDGRVKFERDYRLYRRSLNKQIDELIEKV